MNTVSIIMQHLRVLQIPLVWKFKKVTATLTRGDGVLIIESDSPIENCQSVQFTEDTSLLFVVEFLATCTITDTNKDGTYVSSQEDVFKKIIDIIELPVGYRKQSTWLINQFEQGNKLPLVDRAQELAGEIFNTAGGEIEENHRVVDYYKHNVDMQAIGNALRLARDLRVAVSHMSSVAR